MKFRLPALTTLALVMAAPASPAFADLVVDRPAVAQSTPVASQAAPQISTTYTEEGVIEFSAKPKASAAPKTPAYVSRSSVAGYPSHVSAQKQEELVHQSSTVLNRNDALGVRSSANNLKIDQAPERARLLEVARESASQNEVAARAEGWAKDVPLEMALAQVIPQNWKIETRGVNLKKNLSWKGDRPWVEVLSDLTRDGQFNANVVWDLHTVVIFPVGASDGSSARIDVKPSTSAVVAQSLPTVKAETPANIWKLDPRLTLKGNIEVWTKQAGWNTVIWEAVDYPIAAPAVFQGDFVSSEGPLARLVDAFRNSDQPLEVRLSTMDKVVHVTNKNYQAPVVTPLSPSALTPQVFER